MPYLMRWAAIMPPSPTGLVVIMVVVILSLLARY